MNDLPADSRLWPCFWWITASLNPTGLPADLVDKWRAAGREVFYGPWAEAASLCRAKLAAKSGSPAEPLKAPAESEDDKPQQLTLFEAA